MEMRHINYWAQFLLQALCHKMCRFWKTRKMHRYCSTLQPESTNCKNLKLHFTYNNSTEATATCSTKHFAAQLQPHDKGLAEALLWTLFQGTARQDVEQRQISVIWRYTIGWEVKQGMWWLDHYWVWKWCGTWPRITFPGKAYVLRASDFSRQTCVTKWDCSASQHVATERAKEIPPHWIHAR